MTQPDDWTPMIGLRRAIVGAAWRSLLCLPIWTALVWAVTPAVNLVPGHWAWFGLLGGILALPGVAIGAIVAHGMTERAGLVSPVFTAIGAVLALAVILSGIEIADQFRTLLDWRHPFCGGATGVFATLWIIKATILET